MLVVLLPRSQTESHGPATRIDNRRQLGVQAAFGPAHCLRGLSARGIGPVLMQFDVRAVQLPQFTRGVGRQQGEHPGEQAGGSPATVAGIDRTPRSEALRQITPRHSRPQDVEQGAEHHPVIFRRPASARHCAITPSPGFGPTQVNFFSRFHSGCANSNRLGYIIALPPTRLALPGSTRFEYTP